MEDSKRGYCQRCDNKRYIILPEGDYAVAKECPECRHLCKKCEGLGTIYYKEDGYSFAKDCPDCSALRHRMGRFNAAKLPSLYAEGNAYTLGSFSTITARGEIGNLNKILNKVGNWVNSFSPKGEGRGFLLSGNTGIGKTHLLVGTVRSLTLDFGYSVKFIEYSHLISLLRESFDNPAVNSSEVINEILSADVLAIDELGKGRDTAWQLDVIDELITRSYNTRKTVIATTNLPIRSHRINTPKNSREFQQLAERRTLQDFIGDRVFSRIHQMMYFWEVDAPDYRITELARE